jgi:alpha-tubulin suppressor-like RCC1 family protein
MSSTSFREQWAMGEHLPALALPNATEHVRVPTHIEPGTLPTQKVIKVRCGAKYTVFLTDDGDFWGVGSNSAGKIHINFTKKKVNCLWIVTLWIQQTYLCPVMYQI